MSYGPGGLFPNLYTGRPGLGIDQDIQGRKKKQGDLTVVGNSRTQKLELVINLKIAKGARS